ncbi:hypothetical protein F5B20DRAFT_584807 [Whalleya microplaca]|nr:hypothetical protein F5B20DRAFT_584807 [Whalleya microplaca]
MAAIGDPPEHAVSIFCDITGLLWEEAITRLKANNNDLQRATEEYLEDPNGQKYKWDESQFTTDRQGEANNAGIAFNIQGPDELAPTSYQNSAAPTRPPSRTNNRSPLGRMIDFTANEAAGSAPAPLNSHANRSAITAPTNTAEEDANLQRALAESAAESGLPPQEVGVVDSETNVKYFGPANRPQYDTEQWAMVPTKASVEAANTELSPSARKRKPEEPAFLRQTKDHRVGAILSIYHKIPLVRNILLQCGPPARNYGHNSEWWKGQPILKHEQLVALAQGDSGWGAVAHPEFVEELHRLIAFLDKTERIYGTVDMLVETEAIDPSFGSWMPDVETKFFDAVKDEAINSPGCDIGPMTTVGAILSPDLPQAGKDQLEEDGGSPGDEVDTSFVFLDTQLDYEQYSWVNTFYDAVDHLLWSHALSPDHTFPEDSSYACLVKAPEVFTIRLGGTGLVRPCEVPAIFYADRYVKDRKDLALHFQYQIHAARAALRKLESWEAEQVKCRGERCTKLHGLKQPHDVRECYEKIIKSTERLVERQIKDAQWRYYEEQWAMTKSYSMNDLRLIHTWTGPYTLTPDEELNQKKWESIIQTSKEKIDEVNRGLAECKMKMEEYRGYLEVVGKRLTCQENEVDDEQFVFSNNPDAYHPEYWNPTLKYSLRGVALTNELAYVCVRREQVLIELEETPTPLDQWWKIGYVESDTTPVKLEKVNLEDVLQAAETESKYPLLIYATEAAMEAAPVPLPDPLRMFVRADNRSFQQELAQEKQAQEQQQTQDPASVVTAESLSYVPVASPAKRKHSIAGSSVATRGSSRNSNDELTFSDEPDPVFRDYEEPVTSYEEFERATSSGSGRPVTKDFEFATPKDSWAASSGFVVTSGQPDPSADWGTGTGDWGDIDTNADTTTNTNTNEPSLKSKSGPEMQERGGALPLLAQPGRNTQSGPIDMMDLDVEHHE